MAVATVGTDVDLLSRRVGFIEVVLRFHVAVLASEARQGGLELPGPYLGLLGKLQTPSLGDWSQAGYALAKTLHRAKHEPVSDGFLAFWLQRPQKGDIKRTRAGDAIERICELRNDIVHGQVRIICSESEARQYLRERADDFREVSAGLRFLAEAPLLQIEALTLKSGRFVARLQRHTGSSLTTRSVTFSAAPPVDADEPFLLHRSGRVIPLAPFVSLGGVRDDVTPTARLLAKWDEREKRFLYGTARDATLQALIDPPSTPTPTDALGKVPPEQRRAPFPKDVAASLLADSAETAPPTLEGYLVEARVGAGGSGVVYRARRADSDQPVAVKVLHRELVSDPMQRRRLAAEFDIMRRLGARKVPGIAEVYEYREQTDLGPVIVMEWLPGNDLDAEAARAPLSPDAAVSALEPVLVALRTAHEEAVFHRDVKPANILLDAEGRGRLLDFGIARDTGIRATRTLETIGTMGFAAPEQLYQGLASAKADLYATGMTLAFLLTGRMNVLSDAERIPPPLEAILRQATQRDPERRFHSAAAMLAALREARDRRFGGPPVLAGESLHESYDVVAIEREIQPGFWALVGRECVTDEEVGMLLAADASATRKLQTRFSTMLSAQLRTDLGWRAALQVGPGTLCVFGAGEVVNRACDLLGVTRPILDDATTKVADIKPSSNSDLARHVGQFLAREHPFEPIKRIRIPGLRGDPGGVFTPRSKSPSQPVKQFSLFETPPTSVVSGQHFHVGIGPESIGTQLDRILHFEEIAPWVFAALSVITSHRGARSFQSIAIKTNEMEVWDDGAANAIKDLLPALLLDDKVRIATWSQALQDLVTFRLGRRHLVAGRSPREDLTLGELARTCATSLHELGRLTGDDAPEPWIRRVDGTRFGVLMPFGRGWRYRTIDLGAPETHTIPDGVARVLAESGLFAMGGAVAAQQRKLAFEMEQQALATVRTWPFVAKVETATAKEWSGRTERCDALLIDSRGRTQAVLEVASLVGSARTGMEFAAYALDRLWRYTCAYDCRFGMLINGETFRFYRADAREGLVEITRTEFERAFRQE